MKYKKILLITLFVVITLAGISIPGILLHLTFASKLNTSTKIDESLYQVSNSAISRNASEKLSEYERLKLISGSWESEIVEIDPSYSNISEVTAVDSARAAISTLAGFGCYPYVFDSSYDNWYSWDTHYYKCTETTFHTYSAYFWKITFYRYDENEIHEIYITENGTLFAIANNKPIYSSRYIGNHFSNNMSQYFGEIFKRSEPVNYYTDVSTNKTLSYKEMYSSYPLLFDNISSTKSCDALVLNNDTITADNLADIDISTLSDKTELYHVYQLSNESTYLMYLIPWE